MKMLLVGAGPMAIEYAKVLKALQIDTIVVGRGKENVFNLTKETKFQGHFGGIYEWIANSKSIPDKAIVTVNEDLLGEVTRALIKAGVKSILVEKPGGANFKDVEALNQLAKEQNAEICVGYNRRFMASVIKCRKIIEEDGGLTSFNFEFTEWAHVIKDLVKNPGVKENWFLHNSTHVIDLAFYLGGKPKELSSFTSGSLDWHPKAAIFAGAGFTETGALFNYSANWESPGRWGIELLTNKHRLILSPMEKLQIQNIGSINREFVKLEDELDIKFKPGLFLQTKNFINDSKSLLSIEEQNKMLAYYKSILETKTV